MTVIQRAIVSVPQGKTPSFVQVRDEASRSGSVSVHRALGLSLRVNTVLTQRVSKTVRPEDQNEPNHGFE